MNTKEKWETAAHHSMAMVGGFLGVYALLTHSSTFGSSETTNLIYLLVSGLNGSVFDFLVRLGATLCYIGGIVFATLLPKFLKKTDFRYVAIAIDTLCCLIMVFVPMEWDPVLALYPVFFATAVQWLAYTKAAGFNSATVFSTNNLRQCFAGLTEYLYHREDAHLKSFLFYGGTLLGFHLCVVYGWFALRHLGTLSILTGLPLLLITLAVTIYDHRLSRKA